MHEELGTPERAAARLVHDTLVHLVRKPGQPRMVRVALPEAWDAAAVAQAMRSAYVERGFVEVEVVVLPTTGEPRLLSVVA